MIGDMVRYLSSPNIELKKHCASAIFKVNNHYNTLHRYYDYLTNQETGYESTKLEPLHVDATTKVTKHRF